MGGRRNARIGAAVLAALLIAAVAVFALRGNDDKAAKTPPATSTTPTGTTGTTTAGKAAPRRNRQGVRRGTGRNPDTPAPGTGALLAIADQKPQTFTDPNFKRLGVARSRLNTPWNSIFTEPARLGQWLNAARADGVEPLVAFEHARGEPCPAQPCRLPSVAQYTKAITAFHARYPWVHLLQPWNEANSATQPTGKNPARAAAYYLAVDRVCNTCIITAADVLDGSNLTSWLRRFRQALPAGRSPQLWGLHNYSDTNRFHSDGTKRMLSLVPGQIWFTEAGGIVSFTTADGRVALPNDEQRAARAIRYLFRLAALSPRITRIYIYQWKIDFPGNRFDAGLVGADGRPRPALAVVLQKRSLLR